MITDHFGPWLLMISSLLLAEQAQAFSCFDREQIAENTLTIEDKLRYQSKEIAEWIANYSSEQEIIVIGRFTRNDPTPFLHEEQLEGILALYWPPSDDIQMPNRIEYTYVGAYSFEGHKIDHATLVPFSADAVNVILSITADYEGLVGQLPETEKVVVGQLRVRYDGRIVEAITSFCPTYFPIEPVQVSDLLECYRIGECQ